jgi:hypothetical protein
MQVYCLKPIDPGHASWPASCVGSGIEWVKVLASDCDEARCKVARTTDVPESEWPTKPAKRYAKKCYYKSPWELPEVTSCELHTSGSKLRDDGVLLLSDGRRLPRK